MPAIIFPLTLTTEPVSDVALTLAPPSTLPPVMLPTAEIAPPVEILPVIILPVELIIPPVSILPPVTLPVTDTEVPVCVVASTRAPPSTLPPVMLPVTLINPLDNTLPLALTSPVMFTPVAVNTATFDVPLIVILALPFTV